MPEPGKPSTGFGMKVENAPTSRATSFDREPEGHDRVRHRERVRVLQVHLVLRGADLVV